MLRNGKSEFVGGIVSKDYITDPIDREYFPAYLAKPDGGSLDVKVPECFIRLI